MSMYIYMYVCICIYIYIIGRHVRIHIHTSMSSGHGTPVVCLWLSEALRVDHLLEFDGAQSSEPCPNPARNSEVFTQIFSILYPKALFHVFRLRPAVLKNCKNSTKPKRVVPQTRETPRFTPLFRMSPGSRHSTLRVQTPVDLGFLLRPGFRRVLYRLMGVLASLNGVSWRVYLRRHLRSFPEQYDPHGLGIPYELSTAGSLALNSEICRTRARFQFNVFKP